MIDAGAIDIKKGGAAIPYYMEDPNIRAEFEETLKREGLASQLSKLDKRFAPASKR